MKFHKRPRYSYWSDSKIVGKISGKIKERKPLLSLEEFMLELDKPTPFIDRVIDKVQDIVMFPIDLAYSLKIYCKNITGKTHVLDGKLDKGVWYDLDYRIPCCLFSELEKFITHEKGIETHEWEKTLVIDESWGVERTDPRYGKPTSQALAAIEQDEIWNWWKENKDYHERDFVSLEEEEVYFKEETEMLVRLINIRKSLWT